MIARIFVTPRKDVLDPQGEAIARALRALGFAEVGDVRMGKYLEVRLEGPEGNDPARARDRVDAMCKKLLANLVIEDYRFEIVVDDRRGS